MLAKLMRLFYPYGAVRRVVRGHLRGMQFEVMPGMGATFALGFDVFNLSKIVGRMHDGMQVWDVGANCGQMAMFFSRNVGAAGRVHSFEPVPRNAQVLRGNLLRNGLVNVVVHEVALAAAAGEAEFVFDAQAHQMGGLAGRAVKMPGRGASLRVRCETVDELVARGLEPPDLLKIDVEGGGAEVIAGATKTLRKHRPMIYFELHAEQKDGPELLALQQLQEEWGYSVEVLAGDLEVVPDHTWGATVWCTPPNSFRRES